MRKTMWICDGCDRESLQVSGRPNDWKVVTVSVAGLEGYPTCGVGNCEEKQYDLCPGCASLLSSGVRPKSWPRVESEAAS